MATLQAPDFTVDTIDGDAVSLGDFTGRKKLLVAFSSWCGCRYDLPSWEQINRELAPQGLSVIAVAVDEDPDAVRPWVDAADASFPVLLDRDHVITERYSLVNVPTVVWIDEDDQVVRPNDVAFSDDQFKDFHGIDSGPHLDALRRWVTDDELPLGDADDVRAHQMPPTDDEQRARLEFRIALELRRDGRTEAAEAPLRPGHRAGAARLHHPPGRHAAARPGPVLRRGVPAALRGVGGRRAPVLPRPRDEPPGRVMQERTRPRQRGRLG